MKSCTLEWKKQFSVLGLAFLVNDVMTRVSFVFFSITSSANTMSRFRGSKFYWILGYLYESSEPLIDFLPFVVQTLCQKNSRYFRDFLRKLRGFPWLISGCLSIILEPETLQNPSNPPDSYYSPEPNKTLSHEIGSFGRLPGDDDVIQMQTKYA